MELPPLDLAYRAGLQRFTVRDRGRRQPPERRWQLQDGERPVLAVGRREAYALRRLMAAQHAAELLRCLDRLETRMEERLSHRDWLARIAAATQGRRKERDTTPPDRSEHDSVSG